MKLVTEGNVAILGGGAEKLGGGAVNLSLFCVDLKNVSVLDCVVFCL